jgi:hypothetical protein
LLTFILTVVLIPLHYLYACEVGFWLYRLSEGINTSGTWTRFGGAPHAWTIPMQLPGGLIAAYLSQRIGVFIMLASEIIPSYFIASVLVAIMARSASVFGSYWWKAIMISLGLIWIPVPETVSWIYQVTVLC